MSNNGLVKTIWNYWNFSLEDELVFNDINHIYTFLGYDGAIKDSSQGAWSSGSSVIVGGSVNDVMEQIDLTRWWN